MYLFMQTFCQNTSKIQHTRLGKRDAQFWGLTSSFSLRFNIYFELEFFWNFCFYSGQCSKQYMHIIYMHILVTHIQQVYVNN